MAYVALSLVTDGDTLVTSWGNQVRENFANGVPDIFTAKGEIAVASAGDAAARLSAGSDYQVLQARAGATLGLEYSNGIYSLGTKTAPTGQSIPNNTLTKVQINSAVNDPFSMLDNTNNRIVVASGIPSRHYIISARFYFNLHATSGKLRRLRINVNGGQYVGQDTVSDVDGTDIFMSASAQVQLTAGDYIDLWAQQISGGSLNLDSAYLGLAMIR